MSLTPDQKQAVTDWIAAGDNLSTVQKKLTEQFKISMTYRDVRFLVDDLGLELKTPAPKADASDVTKAAMKPPAASPAPRGVPPPPAAADDLTEDEAVTDESDAGPEGLPPEEEFAEEPGVPGDAPAGASTLKLEVDRIMRPGAVVSGTVTFSDGVTGKWALDQYGRLMLDTPQKGYKPSADDVQAFQRELQTHLARQGY